MTLAVAMPTAAELVSRALEREYVRDAIGQFADVPGVGDDAPLTAKLKGAGLIELLPGERLLRSDRTKGEDGRAWLAVTEKDGKRSLRVGLGNADFGTRRDGNGPWRAVPDRSYEINEEREELRARREDLENEIAELEDDPDVDLAERRTQLEELYDTDADEVFANGYTAILDEQSAKRLRETIDKALDDGEKIQNAIDANLDEIDRLEKRRNELRKIVERVFTDEEDAEWDRLAAEIERLGAEQPKPPEGSRFWTLAEGSIPGEWADVHYDVYLDDPSVGVQTNLGAVSHHHDGDFDDLRNDGAYAQFNIVEADEFVKLLAKMESGHSPESFNRYDLGVRSMPLSRALEAFSIVSSSRAVQLMMVARALEADDSFLRRGRMVHVERGRGGRFGHGIGGAIADAVKAVADTDAPKKRGGRQSAVAKALASGNSLSGFDREPLRLEAKRRGIDVPHGAQIDVIRDMLQDDENATKSGVNMFDVSQALDDLPARRDSRSAAHRMLEPLTLAQLQELGTVTGINHRGMDREELRYRLVDETVGTKMRREGLDDNIDIPATASQMRKRADKLLSDMPSDQAGRDRVHTEVGRLTLDADRMDAAAKPTRARKAPADTDAIADRIRNLPHNSQSRAALAAELDGLGAADMRAVADKWNIPLKTRTTKAQSRKAIEDRLDYLIDADSVLNAGRRNERPPADADEAGSYFSQLKAGHAASLADAREKALAKKAAAEPNTSAQPARARRGGDVSSAVDSLRPMVDNPKPGDREKTDEILGRLTGKQLDDVVKEFNVTLGPTSNVAQKRQRLREWLVGRKIDSDAIARGTTSYTDELGGGRGPKA